MTKFSGFVQQAGRSLDLVAKSSPSGAPAAIPGFPAASMKASFAVLLAILIPVALPQLKAQIASHPSLYRWLWVAGFVVNFIAVSIPGRLDGEVADSASNAGGSKPDYIWSTLFEPSGWAFAIWGAIYLAELLATAYGGVVGQPIEMLKKISPYWLSGHLYQSLWCGLFRKENLSVLWVPAGMLASAAVSFGAAHYQLSSSMLMGGLFKDDVINRESLRLLLFRIPLSLHVGWLAAATLLNLNSWFAISKKSARFQTIAAFSSQYFAAALGAGYAFLTGDPLFAGTISWALSAVADRTSKKAEKARTDPQSSIVPFETQNRLALTASRLATFLKVCAIGVAVRVARAKDVI